MTDASIHGGHMSTPSNTSSPVGTTQRGHSVQTSIIVKDEVHTRQDSNGKGDATQSSQLSTTIYRYTKEELLALSKLPLSLVRPPDLPALYCRDEPGNLVEQRQARPERRPKPPQAPGQSSTATTPSKGDKPSWSRSERDKYKHPGHFEMSEKDKETFGVDVVGPTGFLSPASLDIDKKTDQDKVDADEIILSPTRKQFPSTQLTKDKDPSAPRDSKRERGPRSAHPSKEGHVYAVKSPRKPDEKEGGEPNQKVRYQPKTLSPPSASSDIPTEPENPDKENLTTTHKTRPTRQEGAAPGSKPNKTKQPPAKNKRETSESDQHAPTPSVPSPSPVPSAPAQKQPPAEEQPNMLSKLLGADEYNPKYIDSLFSPDANLVDQLFKNQTTRKERHFSWIATAPDDDDHAKPFSANVVANDNRNEREAEKSKPNPDKELLSSLAFERWFSTPSAQPQPPMPQPQQHPPHMQPLHQAVPVSALENSWGVADNNPLAALFKNASMNTAVPPQDGVTKDLRRSLEPAFSAAQINATANPTPTPSPKPSDFGNPVPTNGLPNMMPNVIPHQMQPNRAKAATPQPAGPVPGAPSQQPRTPQKNEQQQQLPQKPQQPQQPPFGPAPYTTLGAKPGTPQPMYGPNANDPLFNFFQSLQHPSAAQAMLAQQGYPAGYPPGLLMQNPGALNILQNAQLQSMFLQQQQAQAQAQAQAQHLTSPQKYGGRPQQQRAPHGVPQQAQPQPGREMYGMPMHPGMNPQQGGAGGLEKWFGNGILSQPAAVNTMPLPNLPGKLMTLEELESKVIGKQ